MKEQGKVTIIGSLCEGTEVKPVSSMRKMENINGDILNISLNISLTPKYQLWGYYKYLQLYYGFHKLTGM